MFVQLKMILSMMWPPNLIRFPGVYRGRCKGTGWGPALTKIMAPFYLVTWLTALALDALIGYGLVTLIINHVSIH